MAKKTAKAKSVVKKTVTIKAKPPTKKVAAVKKAVPKPVAKTTPKPVAKVGKSNAKGGVSKRAVTPAVKVVVATKRPLKMAVDKKGLGSLKEALIKMRERLTGQISALADDSLKYVDDASSEDRTDDFDRELALNLVSSEHDSVFEIDAALRRIEDGSYGICDGCECVIEKPRLLALPFARMCMKCQSEQEKGRSRFRPFGDTIAQGVEQTPETVEQEETE